MVWFSAAMGHASNQRPLRHSFSETDQLKEATEWGRSNVYGEVLPAACFPTEIYGSPGARDSAYKLPDLWFAGSYWGISKAAADIIRQFEIGNCAFHPV
ncbi:MAG: hypothetical protein ACRC1J_06520, partial [Sandaracinobacteroides sp.]